MSREAMRLLQEAARDGWSTEEEMEHMADTECLGCFEGFKRVRDEDFCPSCATRYSVKEVRQALLSEGF